MMVAPLTFDLSAKVEKRGKKESSKIDDRGSGRKRRPGV